MLYIDTSFWKQVVNDEMDSIMVNKTWVLTDLAPDSETLRCKQIFRKKKLGIDCSLEKSKAR